MKHKDTLRGGKREKNDHYNQSKIYDDGEEDDYQQQEKADCNN